MGHPGPVVPRIQRDDRRRVQVLLQLGHQALGFYQKALSLNAEHRGALEYLGELYLQTGRPKQAKEMLKRLDDACFFGCEEYDDLKKAFQVAKVID